MRDVVLPEGKPVGETYAYSPGDAERAAGTHFAWENYDGEQVFISQSFWRGHLLEAKIWHAFRPGLATNLYRLGASNNIFQKILGLQRKRLRKTVTFKQRTSMWLRRSLRGYSETAGHLIRAK